MPPQPDRHARRRTCCRSAATASSSSTPSCACRSPAGSAWSASSTPATCSPRVADIDLARAADRGRRRRPLQVAVRADPLRPRLQGQPPAGRRADGVVHQLRTGVLTNHEIADCRIADCGLGVASAGRRRSALPACARRDDRSRARGRGGTADHAERRDRRRSTSACRSTDGAADPVRAVLTKLIDRELMLAEVDRYAPPEPTAEAVDREVQRVRARFPSPDALRRGARALGHRREAPARNAPPGSADARVSRSALQRGDRIGGQTLIDDWMAGLRRRGGVIDLYLAGR